MMKTVNVALIPKPGKQSLHKGLGAQADPTHSQYLNLSTDEYNTLDTYMTDSNIGGRKHRRIQDHLFIVNGILFDNNASKKNKPLSICIYDCRQCFDSLWQVEVINDIFDAGVSNDKLPLLYKINSINIWLLKLNMD